MHTYDYYTRAIEAYNEAHEVPVKLENFDLVVSNTVQSSPEGSSLVPEEDAAWQAVRPWMDLKFENYEKVVHTAWIDKAAKSHRFGEAYFLETLELFQKFDRTEYASSEVFSGADGYSRGLTECAFVRLPVLSYDNSYQKEFLGNWQFLGEPTLKAAENL